MTDEKFLFVSDVADKKRTARGIHNKRAHAGKGGKVKFPSDYLSRKEKEAMNGELKSYRMNEPIQWAEFKAMPDDIKVLYIKALRNKFGVTDKEILTMMCAPRSSFSYTMQKIGIASGNKNSKRSWDKDGWEKWLHGIKDDAEQTTELVFEDQTADEDALENLASVQESVSLECVSIADEEIAVMRERIRELESKNAILEAKLSMVYLFFGKEQEHD